MGDCDSSEEVRCSVLVRGSRVQHLGTRAERVFRYLVIDNNKSVFIVLFPFQVRNQNSSKEISDTDLPDIVLRGRVPAMLKWMVTAARGQAGDEVSLAGAGDQEQGIFTISRDNPLYSVMETAEEDAVTVTEIAEYRTLESSHSSGYSSADLNTHSLARSKQVDRCVRHLELISVWGF